MRLSLQCISVVRLIECVRVLRVQGLLAGVPDDKVIIRAVIQVIRAVKKIIRAAKKIVYTAHRHHLHVPYALMFVCVLFVLSLQGLLSGVPDDKMIILDLFTETCTCT